MTFPNYKKNIINISATFAKFLGKETNIPTLKKLEKELAKGYEKVVFIIFDGLGINPIKLNMDKNCLLYKNIKQKLTSVFPSTTTNATTTLMSCKYPMEHGWFGWSLYFEEVGKAIDIYMAKQSGTGEPVDKNYVPNKLPFTAYYLDTQSEYTINTVFQDYVVNGRSENNYIYQTEKEMAEHIINICKKEGKQFVYSYCGQPDYTMHDFGTSSKEAKEKTAEIVALFENMVNSCKNTLFVVTADHGQVDIHDYVPLYEDKEILDLLRTVPYMEPRATAFNVKPDCKEKFEKLFKEKYGKDFKLYKSETLIDNGVFGLKDCNGHKELLGDYISISKKEDKMFLLTPISAKHKGHHTCTGKEMWVPLIMVASK